MTPENYYEPCWVLRMTVHNFVEDSEPSKQHGTCSLYLTMSSISRISQHFPANIMKLFYTL